MSNHRDNSPELDYFELRRRHEQYKSRERMERSADQAPAEKPLRAAAPVEAEDEAHPIQPEIQKPADAFEEAIEEGYEDFENEDFEAADAADQALADDANPFGSFIHFFHGVKDNLSARRASKLEADEPADSIEDLPDESPADLAKDEGIETGFEDEGDDFIDDEYEDLEDLPEKQSGFKKFVGLFVQRVEDDEDTSDADEAEDFEGDDFDFENDEAFEEVDMPEKKSRFSIFGKKHARGNDEDFEPDEGEAFAEDAAEDLPAAPKAVEAASQPKAEENPQPSSSMTRRERRELAMRLAAEEAARKAAEENKADLPAVEEKEAPVDMAAFENAPASDILVETTAEDSSENIAADEPTREFKPISARDLQEAAEKDLFDLDADENEDEDDEFEEKKHRFSLFGKKRTRVKDDADDEDDDDEFADEDDDEFEDADDEDEEFEEKKHRFSLFGKKRARIEYDENDDDEFDDEDEDEDDEFEEDEIADEYDEDEDDEYDEFDDEDDDEDYDDEYDEDEDEYDEDDESRRSFGHHLLGVIKVILGIAAALLVLMIAMNFHYYATGSNVVISFAHDVLGDSAAFEMLCPSYSMRQNLVIAEPAVETTDAAVVESTPAPTALPEPEATAVVPNLDTNSVEAALPTTEAVIEAAPAVEASVVTEGAVG